MYDMVIHAVRHWGAALSFDISNGKRHNTTTPIP